MKHSVTRFSLLGLSLVLALLTLAGCRKEADAGAGPTLTWDENVGPDSIHLSIEFPDYADQRLNTAIVERLSEMLGGSYEGDYADHDSLLHHYAECFRRDIHDMRKDFEDLTEDLPFQLSKELDIWKEYETDRVVSYLVTTYEFTGGAHGFGTCYGVTFRRSDGRQIGLNVLNGRRGDEGWDAMIRDGLKEYFEVETDSALEAQLLGEEVAFLPEPRLEPYFMKDGLAFIYQQYEIAAYAYGRPNFIIPYDKLQPYLSVTGRRLFSGE